MSGYQGPHTKAACEPYLKEVRCPTPGVIMECGDTRYGFRHTCREPGCTMVCWDGPTTTPADLNTRRLRGEAHKVFDALWKGKPDGTRTRMYKRLAAELGIDSEVCHIGMFDKTTCRRVIRIARKWAKADRRRRKRA